VTAVHLNRLSKLHGLQQWWRQNLKAKTTVPRRQGL